MKVPIDSYACISLDAPTLPAYETVNRRSNSLGCAVQALQRSTVGQAGSGTRLIQQAANPLPE